MAMLDAITSSRLQTDLFCCRNTPATYLLKTERRTSATIAAALTAEAGLAENTAVTTAEQ